MRGHKTEKDQEMVVLNKIIENLKPLAPKSRDRVLGYVCDRYVEKNEEENEAIIASLHRSSDTALPLISQN